MMIVFLSLILSSLSFAESCKVSRASSESSSFEEKLIEENKSFSYLSEGGPLSAFKTQDQDGLGTCYANALTAALKVSLPGHDDVSYLHASFLGSEEKFKTDNKVLKRKTVQVDGKDVEVDELFNYGGFTCKTFEAMKSQGGACPSNYSLIENDPNQKKILTALGRYLDHFNDKKPKSEKEFSQNFSLLLEKAKDARTQKKEECKKKKEAGFIPVETLAKSIKYTFNYGNENPCSEKLNEFISTLFESPSEESIDPFLGAPKEEFSQLIKTIFSSYEAISAMASQNDKEKNINSFINLIEMKIKEKMQDKNCRTEPLIPKVLHEVIYDQIKKEWTDYLLLNCDEVDLSEEEVEETFSCFPPELMPLGKDLYFGHQAISEKLGDDFLKDLRKSKVSSSMDELKKELMPECQKERNLIPLDDLSCKGIDLYDSFIEICQADGTCEWGFDKEKVKKSFQDKIFTALENKKGLSISVCTSFMNNQTYTPTDLCRSNTNGVQGHGYHAMSVTGYRCVNGKIQYQIQNSWGSDCPWAAGITGKSDFMECDFDQDGKARGSFWVDEEVLFDSTIEISSLD
jgi:hypothetical protein